MNRKLATMFWGVPVCVLASLAAVWLLSRAVGFRFMPTSVAGISGALSALVIGTRSRSSRA